MRTIVLASQSPRRAELLAQINIPYVALPPEIEEKADHEEPEAFARKVARDKAEWAANRIAELEATARKDAVSDEALVISRVLDTDSIWILGADTLIDVDGEMLGKPADLEDAARMIRRLSDRRHEVVTAMTLLRLDRSGGERALMEDAVRTEVTFGPLTEPEITRYLETLDWADAAGAYRIQSLGATLVERISGSYTNVVGLPLRRFCGMLRRSGYYST